MVAVSLSFLKSVKMESISVNVPDSDQLAVVPHIDQWCGAWAIAPNHLQTMVGMIESIDLRAHLAASAAASRAPKLRGVEPYGYQTYVSNGVANVTIRGVMMKHVASLSQNTSTVLLRRSIRKAAEDPTVRSIMLLIDSPGGTVAGTQALADEVCDAGKRKPVHAFIEDLGSSAAYWVASQAKRVSATPTTLLGGIGTFAVVEDYSKRAASIGIKVHVVKAGEYKGSGMPGTEVTSDHLLEMQRIVDGLNSFFVDAVVTGRGMSEKKANRLADGRIHLANAARQEGLIDAVESYGEALRSLRTGKTKRHQSSHYACSKSQNDVVADREPVKLSGHWMSDFRQRHR